MATTLKRIELLAVGVRDTAGAVVASGKARFYQPGTTTEQTVYQDSAAATPHTQPITLNAGGQAVVYMLEPVRMVVKDTTETTTYFDAPLVVRHDDVYITSPSINGGAETTLEAVLGTASTSFGSGFQYQESAGATARDYVDVIGERYVSLDDFNAVGDGATDNTTRIQAAINRMAARGGGFVLVPVGTYLISSALLIDTPGVCLVGRGRLSVIEQSSSSAHAINVNLGSAIDSKLVIKDLAITASTTSSGAAVIVTNGTRVQITNVQTSLFRTGISLAASADSIATDCFVTSTDDNAAAVGVSLGTRGLARHCIALSTRTGTGILASGNDAMITDCYVDEFATGIDTGAVLRAVVRGSKAVSANDSSAVRGIRPGIAGLVEHCYVSGYPIGIDMSSATSQAEGCRVDSSGTGIAVTAADCLVHRARIAGCSVAGIDIGAVARMTLTHSYFSLNTLDIDCDATSLIEHSNTYTNITDTTKLPHSWHLNRPVGDMVDRTANTSGSPNWQPNPQSQRIQFFSHSSAGAPTVTVDATATTGLVDGQLMRTIIYHGSSGSMTVTWASQYLNVEGGSRNALIESVGSGDILDILWAWRAGASAWYYLTYSLVAG